MRKLNLKNYVVKTKMPDRVNPAELMEVELPYHVKDSILNVMFIRELALTGAELVKQNVLAIKLESCEEDFILLEDSEYDRIKKAFDTYKGWTRPDVELVTRINEAEKVEVEPKK